MRFFVKIILIIVIPFISSLSQQDEKIIINIDKFLCLGPIEIPAPVNIGREKDDSDLKDLLLYQSLLVSTLWPSANEIVEWKKGKKLRWKIINAENNIIGLPETKNSSTPKVNYLVTYLYAERWLNVTLNLKSYQLLNVFLDGESIASKTSYQKSLNDSLCNPGLLSDEIDLETGKHILVVKVLSNQNQSDDIKVEASIILNNKYNTNELNVNNSPKFYTGINQLLDNPKITDVSISPDGNIAAVTISKRDKTNDRNESWIELFETNSRKVLQTYRGGIDINGLVWAPFGKKFSYTTSNKNGKTLWFVDIEKGTTDFILKDIKDMGSYDWSPDGSFIIYSVTEKPEDEEMDFKRHVTLQDRQPGARNESYLYLVNIPSKSNYRLTRGIVSTNLRAISPDGGKIIFSRNKSDLSTRPFSRIEYYVMDLETMDVDSLINGLWGGSAIWSPDGNKILLLGGPATFGKIGENVPEGMITNFYDTQAYIFDLNTKKIDPITKNFDPSIVSAYWNKNDNAIYFSTTDKSFGHLYKYDTSTKSYMHIDLGIEKLNQISFAAKNQMAVYSGSSSNIPRKAYVLNLNTGERKLLLDPDPNLKNLKLGKVEDFSFDSQEGREILGRVYYPPDFDEDKNYPGIVYYYGGTSPVTREFEGRYPKNIWAANGYVVYILQPSGAKGFGQEFSALHVNDWGNTTANEIIEGTKEFLNAHPFVDPEKVGCIGASYGGFMTMNLITKTDIFTAAVSHAGISSLTSYWGEGFWGYSYSAVATADSYPWNRKDIYVDYSPIFNADKVNTPLLLLHGSADTNVPPGESIQMYTALKLLSKDVEFIELDQQNHHIMEYDKRKKWTKTIIAYFDKYLKEQPEWWNDLYGE